MNHQGAPVRDTGQMAAQLSPTHSHCPDTELENRWCLLHEDGDIHIQTSSNGAKGKEGHEGEETGAEGSE